MINPTFKDVVTHYHQKREIDEVTKRSNTVWVRNVYKNCYFGTNEAESVSGNTLSQASSYTVRIPHENKKIEVISGDIIVRGEVSDEISNVQGERTTDLISKYKPDCFTVRVITDNTKIKHGAHYKLTGA